jgi:hypothetical protein
MAAAGERRREDLGLAAQADDPLVDQRYKGSQTQGRMIGVGRRGCLP